MMIKTPQSIAVVRSVLSIFLAFFAPILVYGQQSYLMIDMDSLSVDYRITHFNLPANDLYGVDENIEIFNVLPLSAENPRVNTHISKQKSRYLFTFSVLPAFDSNSNWTSYSEKPTDLVFLSFEDLLRVANGSIQQNHVSVSFDKYRVLLKKNNRYYIPKVSFLQVFYIQDYPVEFNIPNGVIDINQPFLTIRSMKDIYEKEFKGGEFPLLPDGNARSFDNQILKRFYLSSKFIWGKDEGYKFWTFQPWGGVVDDVEWERGIDRFVYVPEKGVVGGSYDFYFKDSPAKHSPPVPRRNISMLAFKRNILDEKIMLARELRSPVKE